MLALIAISSLLIGLAMIAWGSGSFVHSREEGANYFILALGRLWFVVRWSR